jgi:hypothetical protein
MFYSGGIVDTVRIDFSDDPEFQNVQAKKTRE